MYKIDGQKLVFLVIFVPKAPISLSPESHMARRWLWCSSNDCLPGFLKQDLYIFSLNWISYCIYSVSGRLKIW